MGDDIIVCCDREDNHDPNNLQRFQKYLRALHCPIRWTIIRLIGESTKGTGEILEGIKERGEDLARSSLYYHLSELEDAGIIELAEYREIGGGAPEKVWRLKIREIKINLLKME